MKLIETVEELKKDRPDLVELWENMSREELLKEIYKESLDAINMETRVQLFMEECTSLSKTTYNLDSIKSLINSYQESSIADWCKMTIEDSDGDKEYVFNEVIEKANESTI